jgi:SAM-dependent methyltransferase
MMDAEAIRRKKADVVGRFGEWTAHNIHLGQGVYTIADRVVGDEIKLRRVAQIVADLAAVPFHEMRVLDLACLEGLYAVELARRGAQVVAVEGRHTNIEKARLAAEVLGLDRLELLEDDVRAISVERHGQFDVVLCLGILYHLSAPDVMRLSQRLAEVCRRLCVIDTHVSLSGEETYVYEDRPYRGSRYWEHSPEASREQRLQSSWASLDNETSFWLTKQSLLNLLAWSGFTSVYECHVPEEPGKPQDRLTLVALKGLASPLLCAPNLHAAYDETASGAEQADPE